MITAIQHANDAHERIDYIENSKWINKIIAKTPVNRQSLFFLSSFLLMRMIEQYLNIMQASRFVTSYSVSQKNQND